MNNTKQTMSAIPQHEPMRAGKSMPQALKGVLRLRPWMAPLQPVTK